MAQHNPAEICPPDGPSLAAAVLAVARATTFEEIVEALRATARPLIGCDGISIIRQEGDLCHYVEEDAIQPLWKGESFPSVACISGWAMTNRKTAVIPDISTDPRIPLELYGTRFVKSLAMAPIDVDESVGAIGAYWAEPHMPTTHETAVLTTLAEAAAAAARNILVISSLSDMARETRRKARDPSRVMSDLDDDIARVGEIAAVPGVLDVMLGMTGLEFAAVSRVTNGRWVVCAALDPGGVGPSAGTEMPLESTVCASVMERCEPIAINDLSADDRLPMVRDAGFRSCISLPIILADGRVFGTLCAMGRRPASVDTPQVLGAFKLFAELVSNHLDAGERLRMSQKSLRQEKELSELREQFIAVLGHDLRNPIAAVDAGAIRILKSGWNERTPAILKLMKSSAERMARLVDDVMDLARARLGEGMSVVISECDIASTLTQVVEEVRVAHPDRHVSVSIDIPGKLSVDHGRIGQMVSNLVANAITHGAADHPVVVTGERHSGEVTICVRNGGKPISPDQLDKLFLPFRRGTAQIGKQGLGLGLYIASQIAGAHGGRIEVTSDEDMTCFTFRMPVPEMS